MSLRARLETADAALVMRDLVARAILRHDGTLTIMRGENGWLVEFVSPENVHSAVRHSNLAAAAFAALEKDGAR